MNDIFHFYNNPNDIIPLSIHFSWSTIKRFLNIICLFPIDSWSNWEMWIWWKFNIPAINRIRAAAMILKRNLDECFSSTGWNLCFHNVISSLAVWYLLMKSNKVFLRWNSNQFKYHHMWQKSNGNDSFNRRSIPAAATHLNSVHILVLFSVENDFVLLVSWFTYICTTHIKLWNLWK